MGKLKTAGIIIGAIFGLIIIASIASGISYASKYDGLTEQEINSVQRIKEACDGQATIASLQSDKAAEIVTKKCEEIEAKKIAEYRAN